MIDDINIWLLLIIAFAAFVHGSIGFGFPMVATPILAMFIGLKSAIYFTLIPTLMINIFSIVLFKESKRVIVKYIPFALLVLLGSIIGTVLLLWINASWFKLLLAFVILWYLSLDFLKKEFIVVNNLSKFITILFALFGGLVGGLTNVMAPILIIYILIQNYSKKESIIFLNLSFLLGKISQLAIFILSEEFIASNLLILSILVSLLGFYTGNIVKGYINEVFYKKIMKLILFCIAIVIILQYFLL